MNDEYFISLKIKENLFRGSKDMDGHFLGSWLELITYLCFPLLMPR